MNTRSLGRAGIPALADDNEIVTIAVPALNDRDDNGR